MAGGQLIGKIVPGPTRYYYLKDHLGSIRVTVKEDNTIAGWDDYYPFGMVMAGRSGNSGQADTKYKFIGVERDVETGYDATGPRFYDSRIGRFLSVDPLSDTPLLLVWSPYHYSFGNPMRFKDPNGTAPSDYYDENGRHLKHVEDKKDDVYVKKPGGETTENIGDKTESFEKVGVVADFLSLNGATLSNPDVSRSLVGFALYLRNIEGISGARISVTGGDRDKDRNSKVSSSSQSPHVSHEAADIAVAGMSLLNVANAAVSSRLFKGVGYYPDYGSLNHGASGLYQSGSATGPHVHVDIKNRNWKATYYGYQNNLDGTKTALFQKGILQWPK